MARGVREPSEAVSDPRLLAVQLHLPAARAELRILPRSHPAARGHLALPQGYRRPSLPLLGATAADLLMLARSMRLLS